MSHQSTEPKILKETFLLLYRLCTLSCTFSCTFDAWI